MTKCIIFDIDGTLSNLDHRLHYVQGGRKDWDSFFKEMDKDLPVEEIVWLNDVFWTQTHDVAVLIVTARPDNYKEMTTDWLWRHGIAWDAIYMRKADDTRKDSVVKKEILDQIRADGYDPFIVIDDRQQVVDMWRENGICTLQCAANEAEDDKFKGRNLLTIMVGPSGAGKSTYIDNNKLREAYDVVSTDEIRDLLFGRDAYMNPLLQTWEHHQKVFEYAHSRIKNNLKHGIPTIFDATNLRNKDRKAVVDLAPSTQIVNYMVFNRSIENKQKTRGWRPDWLVDKHENTFKSNLKDILRGDGYPNVTVYDMRSV